jgi:Flp pilus assembly protein TadD
MHVESVAWIAERKDVLYAFFYLFGLIAYLRYLGRLRWTWFAACLAAFVLSLASKPAAVVFPLTLLGLDYFLRRTDRQRLLLEKLPFFVLSIAAGLLTLVAQQASGAVAPAGTWSLFQKLLFASYGSLMYVLKLFVPVGLSAVYPYPRGSSSIGPEFYGALIVMLIAFPALLFLCRRLRPVLFGWAFFFINLVLVLQFLTIGRATMADRYTYVPYIGLLLALTWWLDERPQPGKVRVPARLVIGAVLVAMLPLSLYQTWTRCSVWKNSGTLWADTVRKFPHRIDIAYNYLGLARAAEGKLDEAIADYHEAIRLRSDYSAAYNNLGAALVAQGRLEEAAPQYRQALWLADNLVEVQDSLGRALAAQGKRKEAASHYREALRLGQENSRLHYNLAAALVGQGKLEEAISHFRACVRLDPNFNDAYNNLGVALMRVGHFDEAIPQFRRALELDPRDAVAEQNLALALQKAGRLDEAGAPGTSTGQVKAKEPTPAPAAGR